jgi:hypothetical protein
MPPKNKIKLKLTKQMLPMQLTVLGNGAVCPFQGRHCTAQVLQFDNQHFLIDFGEGTQMQMHRMVFLLNAFGRFLSATCMKTISLGWRSARGLPRAQAQL